MPEPIPLSSIIFVFFLHHEEQDQEHAQEHEHGEQRAGNQRSDDHHREHPEEVSCFEYQHGEGRRFFPRPENGETGSARDMNRAISLALLACGEIQREGNGDQADRPGQDFNFTSVH